MAFVAGGISVGLGLGYRDDENLRRTFSWWKGSAMEGRSSTKRKRVEAGDHHGGGGSEDMRDDNELPEGGGDDMMNGDERAAGFDALVVRINFFSHFFFDLNLGHCLSHKYVLSFL